VALSPDHCVTAGQLLNAADQAMYRAKQGRDAGIALGHAEAAGQRGGPPEGELAENMRFG
jgi:GGDEF domain-containing protein